MTLSSLTLNETSSPSWVAAASLLRSSLFWLRLTIGRKALMHLLLMLDLVWNWDLLAIVSWSLVSKAVSSCSPLVCLVRISVLTSLRTTVATACSMSTSSRIVFVVKTILIDTISVHGHFRLKGITSFIRIIEILFALLLETWNNLFPLSSLWCVLMDWGLCLSRNLVSLSVLVIRLRLMLLLLLVVGLCLVRHLVLDDGSAIHVMKLWLLLLLRPRLASLLTHLRLGLSHRLLSVGLLLLLWNSRSLSTSLLLPLRPSLSWHSRHLSLLRWSLSSSLLLSRLPLLLLLSHSRIIAERRSLQFWLLLLLLHLGLLLLLKGLFLKRSLASLAFLTRLWSLRLSLGLHLRKWLMLLLSLLSLLSLHRALMHFMLTIVHLAFIFFVKAAIEFLIVFFFILIAILLFFTIELVVFFVIVIVSSTLLMMWHLVTSWLSSWCAWCGSLTNRSLTRSALLS